LGSAFVLKRISDAIERTDRHAARNAALAASSPDRTQVSLTDEGRR
jgi:hypothetical protein